MRWIKEWKWWTNSHHIDVINYLLCISHWSCHYNHEQCTLCESQFQYFQKRQIWKWFQGWRLVGVHRALRYLTHFKQFCETFLSMTVYWQISDRYMTDFWRLWYWVPKYSQISSKYGILGNLICWLHDAQVPRRLGYWFEICLGFYTHRLKP